MQIYVHIYEGLLSNTWSPNRVLPVQPRFLDWCLTRFGRELFISGYADLRTVTTSANAYRTKSQVMWLTWRSHERSGHCPQNAGSGTVLWPTEWERIDWFPQVGHAAQCRSAPARMRVRTGSSRLAPAGTPISQLATNARDSWHRKQTR